MNAVQRETRVRHYPKNIGDWMAATAHLSSVEECMYSRLVDQYYAREAPLPLDIPACCRLARAVTAAERKAVAVVVPEYFEQESDGWHQKRCDLEIAAYLDRSASASLSAQARWTKTAMTAMRTHSDRNANAPETHCVGNATRGDANQEPVTKNQRTTPLPPSGVRGDVWEEWRKYRGKKLTPRAVALQAERLAQFAAVGDDPNEVIEQSIRNGWTGLFPLGELGRRPLAIRLKTLAERRADNIADITGRSRRERTVTDAVGGEAVLPALRYVREQDDGDVG